GAWQRVGGLPLGCGADVVVAACEAETPGSDRPSNRYSSGVLVPRLLAHLPHFLVVVSTVVVLSVRVSKQFGHKSCAPCDPPNRDFPDGAGILRYSSSSGHSSVQNANRARPSWSRRRARARHG